MKSIHYQVNSTKSVIKAIDMHTDGLVEWEGESIWCRIKLTHMLSPFSMIEFSTECTLKGLACAPRPVVGMSL